MGPTRGVRKGRRGHGSGGQRSPGRLRQCIKQAFTPPITGLSLCPQSSVLHLRKFSFPLGCVPPKSAADFDPAAGSGLHGRAASAQRASVPRGDTPGTRGVGSPRCASLHSRRAGSWSSNRGPERPNDTHAGDPSIVVERSWALGQPGEEEKARPSGTTKSCAGPCWAERGKHAEPARPGQVGARRGRSARTREKRLGPALGRRLAR